MTALIWLLPVAALVLGLTALVVVLLAELKKADARCGDLTADLATQNAAADRLHRLARYRGLQTAMERARTRDALAQRDDAHMEAARTLRRVWALQADNERLVGWEQAQLDAAVSTVEDWLREIGAGT